MIAPPQKKKKGCADLASRRLRRGRPWRPRRRRGDHHHRYSDVDGTGRTPCNACPLPRRRPSQQCPSIRGRSAPLSLSPRTDRTATAGNSPASHPHAPACCLYRQTRSGAARWRRSPREGYKTHLPPCCWHTPFFFCFALVRAWRWRLAAAGTGCMRTTVTKNTVAGGIV